MKKLLLLYGLLLAYSAGAQIDISRDVFGSSGKELSNANFQMSFTIGETFTSTLSNNEIHTLGFQQSKQSSVSLIELSEVEIGIYPNPANDQITFVTSFEDPFTYKILDITGRIILEGKHKKTNLTLDVSNLVEGKYFFQYSPENQETLITTFLTIH